MSPAAQTAFDLGLWHLAESTAFALITIGLVFTFRLRRGSSRFLFYQLAILKFLVPVGALASLYLQPGVLASDTLSEIVTLTISASSGLLDSSRTNGEAWILGVTWLAGFLLLGTARAIGYYRSRHLGSEARESDRLNSVRITKALSAAGQPDNARLPISQDDQIPSIGLVGIFRPRIIINAAFLETLSDQELLAAIRHELAHARRFDNFWRLSHELVASLFWFHPLVWLLRSKLRTESELACDESALSQGEEPQRYAKCLLKAASLKSRYTNLWVTSFSAASLKNRIRKIITFENKKESKMKLSLMYLSLLCALSLFALSSSNLYADPAPTEKVYSLSEVDKKPSAKVMVRPLYPQSLLESKISGSVVISFILDSEGEVQQARAIKSTHDEFKAPAIDAVLQSTWNPGQIEGKPVSTVVRIPILFKP